MFRGFFVMAMAIVTLVIPLKSHAISTEMLAPVAPLAQFGDGADLSTNASFVGSSSNWVLACDWKSDGFRCESDVGLVRYCEGQGCHQVGCIEAQDCIDFASTMGWWNSCRTYSCLNGQCVDQFGIDKPFFSRPGDPCYGSNIAGGMCGLRGECQLFDCKETDDCPDFGPECSAIVCDVPNRTCMNVPHPPLTPCSWGTCTGGYCN